MPLESKPVAADTADTVPQGKNEATERVLQFKPRVVQPHRPFAYEPDLANDQVPVQRSLSDRFCATPWETFDVRFRGVVGACCPGYLPKPIGKLPEDTVESAWNSEAAQEIRASILDGSFRHCRAAVCPLIAGDSLPKRDEITDPFQRDIIDRGLVRAERPPRFYNLSYDESCNLSCPSCRTKQVSVTSGPEYEQLGKIQSRIFDAALAQPHDEPVEFNVTGSGDPFGSRIFREFLTSVDGRSWPNALFHFQTNGVLFTRSYWRRISGIRNNIGRVFVSIDAATPETYAITRRGGHWGQLLENMRLIDDLRREGIVRRLQVFYVVQAANYREMPALIRLLEQFPAVDWVNFSLISNWATFSDEEFRAHAIWRSDHPQFDDFLRVLRDPALSSQRIFWGNVLPYRERALASAPSLNA